MTLVFLDTETTGLDPRLHSVWEIAYAVNDGPIRSSFVAHSPEHADPTALKLNGYLTRFKGEPLLGLNFEANLRADLAGATLVGANPRFDAAFLEARWGDAPWHYRLWDIEAYAAGVLNLPSLLGLKDLYAYFNRDNAGIPAPNHTAAGDVATTRAIFHRLRMANLSG